MDLQWRIQIVDELIKEDPNARIIDYINLINELNKISMHQYDLKSAIMKMPFGKHKDKIFWTLGKQYFSWLQTQPHTRLTEQTIEDAIQLWDNQGAFAVMKRNKKDKYWVKLETIMQSERMAKARVDDNNQEWEYFVYAIQDRTGQPEKPKGYFPGSDDEIFKIKN